MIRRLGRSAATLGVAVAMLAGCTQTVSGHGAPGGVPSDFPSGGPSSPSGTSGGGATAPPSSPVPPSSPAPTTSPPTNAHLACPRVVDPAARLEYSCIAAGMTLDTASTMWPVKVQKTVDTNWTMDEGSGRLPFQSGSTLGSIANDLAQTMAATGYGTGAKATKERDTDTSVDGHKAHLVQTLMTISPAFRQANKLRVSQERLWIVVVQLSETAASAWYVSVPDVQKQLWPSVPGLISGMQVF